MELADKLEYTFKDQKDMICGTIRIGATEAVGCCLCLRRGRQMIQCDFCRFSGLVWDDCPASDSMAWRK